MTIQQLRQERAEMIKEARALVDAAESEKRDLTGEESNKYDELLQGAVQRADRIKRQEAIEAEERTLDEATERAERQQSDDRATADGGIMDDFRSFLAGQGASPELRSLSQGIDTEGGFLVAPQEFVNALIKFVDNDVFIRGLATTIQVSGAHSLGIPSLDADPADADWTTELQTGSEDNEMKFGKREFKPHPLAKRIKVSQTLLRNGALPVEQIVRERLAYKFAISQEKAFMTGDGAGKPLGLFTVSNNGIPASQDVVDTNTATKIKADALIATKYSLKAQYMRNGQWIFHRDAMKQIATLKDGEGQYLWRPNLVGTEPDTLLGRPLNMSEYAPNIFTTGELVGIFGDFSHYHIVDCLALQMQRLVELYAETNQIGFIGRLEADGMPTLAEAFARVKLA